MQVWEYKIPFKQIFSLVLPVMFEILCIKLEDGQLIMHVLVGDCDTREKYSFIMVQAGDVIPECGDLYPEYLDSVQFDSMPTLHFFILVEEQRLMEKE